jgi:mRNA interferase RelE/StbE
MYEVVFGTSAAKEFEKLPIQVGERLMTKIESLAQEPRPPGCKKSRGEELYRDYRVIYSIDDQVLFVEIVRVRRRDKAYD